MAAFQVTAVIGNLSAEMDRLRKMRSKVGPTVKKATTKGAQVLTKGQKSRAIGFRESGLLWKSLGYVVRVYGDGRVIAAVGPRTGFKQAVVILDGKGAIASSKTGQRLAAKGGKTKIRDPIRYAHLAERAHGFMRAAQDQDGPAAVEAMRQVFLDEMEINR